MNDKIKAYFIVAIRMLGFYSKKHPYIAVWVNVWAVYCTWKYLTTFSVFWIVWMCIVILGIIVPYKIYVFLDELSSPSDKEKRRIRREREKEELKAYVEEGLKK